MLTVEQITNTIKVKLIDIYGGYEHEHANKVRAIARAIFDLQPKYESSSDNPAVHEVKHLSHLG